MGVIMNRERKLRFGNRKLYRNILVEFLIICILMGGLCYQYYRRIQDTVKAESGEYMQEISKQIGTNISRMINDNFAILETISTVLRNANITSYEQLQTIAIEQKDYWKFHNLLLIYEDGMAYDAYGKKVALGSSEYLQEVVVNGIRSMSSAQIVNDKECIIFTIPLDDTKIGGAEALVRWMSSTEGMIYPDEFIPLFERNGFIVQLDLWVFDQVCTTIHTWLDRGLEPIKISVNCSRFHLRNPNFLNSYREICERNRIPAKYIEIELTENTVFENVELLTQTINEIHKMGFGCSMDDFGSGYSSLNLIQDIPVDTLKLDKIFFKNGIKDLQRTESVVKSIITMSKALSMQTVAEGVEERFHVDMLKRLGCSYIQGYYFARPMPIVEFERLTFGTRMNPEMEVDV